MKIKNKEAIMTKEHELALAKERSDKADAEVRGQTMGHYASELICEKCNTFSCICPTVHDTKRTIKSTEVKRLETEVKRLETLLFKLGAMNDPPCFCCGYNGPGYFDVKVHPCADRHHKLYEG